MRLIERSGKLAIINLWRNKILSVSTIVVMSLILFIFNVILTINVLSNSIIKDIYKQVDMIIYLQDSADIFEINLLVEELKTIENVIDVTYTTKEEALEDYLSLYPDQENPFTAYGLENPLPANIQITTVSPEDHEKVTEILNKTEYQDLQLTTVDNNENQSLVNQVLSIGTYTKNLTITLLTIFIVTSFIIILNAMYLVIFNRKKELEIMELVGAPLSSIRMPFIIEGAIISLSAATISLFLIGTFISSLNLPVTIESLTTTSKVLTMGIFEIIISIGIGVLSGSMAIEHHLKRN